MQLVKKNLIATYAGRISSAVMGLMFVPLYVNRLGLEAYALVGLYGTLLSLSSLLELGLGASLSRRLAWLSCNTVAGQEMRDLTRTLGIFFIIVTIFSSLCVVITAPIIRAMWLPNADNIIENIDIDTCIDLMGISVVVRLPFSVYSAALIGLQRHVQLNIATILLDILRYVGAAVIVSVFQPTLDNFFSWHIFVGAVTIFTGAGLVGRYLPSCSDAPRFRIGTLREVWRFAAGVSGITVTFTLINAGDKLVLSKVLDLQSLGYYVIAYQVAAGISTLYYPIFLSYYPKITQAVGAGDAGETTRIFHTMAQLLAITMLPCLAVVLEFGDTILFFWTNDPRLANEAAPVLGMLMLGISAIGLWHAPYALQLAAGKTRLVLTINVIGVLFLLPGLYVFAPILGVTGTAGVWAAVCGLHLLIGGPIFLLIWQKAMFFDWLIKDLTWPILSATVASVAASEFAPSGASDVRRLLFAMAWSLLTALAVAAASPAARGTMRSWVARAVKPGTPALPPPRSSADPRDSA